MSFFVFFSQKYFEYIFGKTTVLKKMFLPKRFKFIALSTLKVSLKSETTFVYVVDIPWKYPVTI